ncbi:DoxX family protein (plasmid) [Ketogulonicigenium robustum]|uniref:DoxX family protein n=1 Tax=Ketogulonicigenium robustum TaxID=92947 RepID=A0A1W6P2Z7_9RHOB|nr:DoxX family protein [Ketogulonicigenium robustum]ARO15856.1 DoxX family protein [Ketogulonicigenium robustum]
MMLTHLALGSFYLPHGLGKITGFAGTVGFPAPAFFLALAMRTELVVAKLTNRGARYPAIFSIGLMAVAALAQFSAKGPNLYWARGGIEYQMFWLITSVAVFLNDWRKSPGLFDIFKTL